MCFHSLLNIYIVTAGNRLGNYDLTDLVLLGVVVVVYIRLCRRYVFNKEKLVVLPKFILLYQFLHVIFLNIIVL